MSVSTAESRAGTTPWRILGAALALAALALGGLFWREVVGAWRVWLASPTYNHGFLVLPVALYLIWDRRAELDVPPRADLRVLALLPLLSLAWLGAAVLGVLELQQLVVITIVQAMLLAAFGWPLYRRMLGPLLYLYLLVPSGEVLVPTLQDFTARFAVWLLQLAHVPVFSDGIIISIPEGDFIVAEACAGLRFLIASIAFGAFFALLVYRSWWKRAAFMATSLIVPVFANGVRAFGIIYLAHLTSDVTAVEADHIVYGWGFFTLILLLLIVIGMRFADRGRPASRTAAAPAFALRAPLVAVAAAVALAAIGPAYLSFLDNAQPLDLSRAAPPPVAAPWTLRADDNDSWNPVIVAPDRAFRDGFESAGHDVERYVALYAAYGRHNTLVRSQNRIADEDVWARSTRGSTRIDLHGRPVTVSVAELHSGAKTRLAWYFYVVDGVVTANPAEAKLVQARAIVEGRDSVSAFVAIATPIDNGAAAARQVLASFVDAMGPLPAYLDRVRAEVHRAAARS
ncbi:MAG: EpsI family protein [Alphaproteobacteria bacterium]|nr:EpsI family protein [Alphaproteobacteria bacterium]